MDESEGRAKLCEDCPDEPTEHDLEVAQQAIDRLSHQVVRGSQLLRGSRGPTMGELDDAMRRSQRGLTPDLVIYDDVPSRSQG